MGFVVVFVLFFWVLYFLLVGSFELFYLVSLKLVYLTYFFIQLYLVAFLPLF